AEEGLWKFEDKPDRDLVFFACSLLQRNGRGEDANGLLWKQFVREPSVELYQRLKSTAGDREAQVLVRDKALAALRGRAEKSRRQAEWGIFGVA
ncbi:hypothetical protein, partial [Streptomyces niveiscabiei]